MKHTVTAIILILLAMPSSFAQTQGAMNQNAFKQYAKADQKLNQAYQQLQHVYKRDREFLRNLKQAQLAWIQFRDTQVAMKYPSKAGMGSVAPMCRASYIQQLTEQRTAQLQEWLDGVPEGDVCAGTITMRRK